MREIPKKVKQAIVELRTGKEPQYRDRWHRLRVWCLWRIVRLADTVLETALARFAVVAPPLTQLKLAIRRADMTEREFMNNIALADELNNIATAFEAQLHRETTKETLQCRWKNCSI